MTELIIDSSMNLCEGIISTHSLKNKDKSENKKSESKKSSNKKNK